MAPDTPGIIGHGSGNATVQSEGMRKVIVITPKNDCDKEILKKPEKFCLEFEKSQFSKLEIKDVRINSRKSIIVVEFSEPRLDQLKELCKVKKIGPWDVEWRMLHSRQRSIYLWSDTFDLYRHLLDGNEEQLGH